MLGGDICRSRTCLVHDDASASVPASSTKQVAIVSTESREVLRKVVAAHITGQKIICDSGGDAQSMGLDKLGEQLAINLRVSIAEAQLTKLAVPPSKKLLCHLHKTDAVSVAACHKSDSKLVLRILDGSLPAKFTRNVS